MEIVRKDCDKANYATGRRGFHPEAIVVHTLAGSLEQAATEALNPNALQSSHYAISLAGDVHQFVDESDTAFHAGIVVLPDWELLKSNGVNPNYYTIGIAFERTSEAIWPGAQAFAGNLLTLEIASRWGIALDADHVIGHNRIRASQSCPAGPIELSRLFRPAPSPANPALPSKAIKLKVLRSARIRYQFPNTATPVAEICSPDTEIEVVGFTLGERVQNNPYWYATLSGNYLWAGATNRPTPSIPS